jgi:signal peptide peptidase SppA
MAEAKPPLRVLRYIRSHPWAMLDSAFDAMLEVVEMRAAGVRLLPDEAAAKVEASRRQQPVATAPGSIMVLNLFGVIAQRMDMFSEISGGTSTESFGAMFDAAMVDPNVVAVVLNIDSPGGSVYGVQELAAKIMAARGVKPISAVANSMAASAAYWLGCQCSDFACTPSGEVGSIGVVARHQDVSGAHEAMGIKTTYITTSKFKAEGNPHEPLSEEARAAILAGCEVYDSAFVKAVATGRGVSQTKVREGFGQGRMLTAQAALDAGMVDRVATLQQVVDGLVTKQGKGGARAEELPVELAADADSLSLARARRHAAAARRVS